MKKTLFAFFPWLLLGFGYKAMAQNEIELKSDKEIILKKDKDKKQTEEIVIRKKGDKDLDLNVVIKGDEILINGKPLSEYKDDDITVNKRKMIVRNRDGNVSIFDNDDEFPRTPRPPMTTWSNESSGAFLGVSTDKDDDGAKITEEVDKETAAGKAGLQKGDIIMKLDDKKIDGPGSLFEAVNAKKPKDEVKITYKRNGKEKTTKATLGERKVAFAKSYSFSSPDGSARTFTMPYTLNDDNVQYYGSGEEFQDRMRSLQDRLGDLDSRNFNFEFSPRPKLGLKIQDTEEGNGVKVLEVADSSAAANAGLKKDDIITEIGGTKISNTDEARDQLHENAEKSSYQVKARRNGSEMTFTVKIPKKLKTTNL